VDLDALLALANAAVTVDSNISPGGAFDNPVASTSVLAYVPTGANVPSGSTSVPANVPTSVAHAGVKANASFSKTLLGDDVSEDNFPVIMAALIKRKKQDLAEKLAQERKDSPMTQGQQRTYMR
nr:hypothetical protein [Tanacetum cinerariifolium]